MGRAITLDYLPKRSREEIARAAGKCRISGFDWGIFAIKPQPQRLGRKLNSTV
jgi:hypothetical protein